MSKKITNNIVDIKTTEITNQILNAIEKKNFTEMRKIFSDHAINNVVNATNAFSIKQLIIYIRGLKQEQAAELFSFLDPTNQEALIKAFSEKEINDIISEYKLDNLREFLDEMPANITTKILASINKDLRQEINTLFTYNDNEAGSVMNTEFIILKNNWTVKDAKNEIRAKKDIFEKIDLYYVTDEQKNLVGWLNLQDLFFEKETAKIKNLMKIDNVVVHTKDDKEEVANLMRKYDLKVIPVLNRQDKICGIITAEDIMDVLSDEATEDFQRFGGSKALTKPYLKTSIWILFRARIWWLLALLILSTFTEIVIDWGQNWTANTPQVSVLFGAGLLATIAPVITDSAGNAGTQSSTIIIRALILGELKRSDYMKVFWKELKLGLLIGVTMSLFNFVRLIPYFAISIAVEHPTAGTPSQYPDGMVGAMWLGMVSSIGIFFAVVFTKMVGAFLPILAKEIKLDPATMAAPLLTTVSDVISSLLFYSVTVLICVDIIRR